jgi:DNA-binding NarL/FixJ family response regulator
MLEQVPIRILVVDDQQPFREAARALIEVAPDFEWVGEAISGESAIEMATLVRPDVILMDVHLPGISGLQATVSIVARNPGVVVVLVSASAPEPEHRALAAADVGARAYLPKTSLEPDVLANIWRASQPAG